MRNDHSGGLATQDPPVRRDTRPSTERAAPPASTSKEKPSPARHWFRRRRYFINPRIQGPLLLHALGYAFFFLLVMALGIFSPLVEAMEGLPAAQQNPFWNPAYSLLYLHTHFWPLALLAVSVIALHSILSSHRMAGPLFRLSALFRAMKKGELPGRQVIRKRDFLHPEFEEFNAMVEAWREKIQEARKEAANLEKLAGLLQEEALFSESATLLDLVQSITDSRKKLSKSLNWFHGGDLG